MMWRVALATAAVAAWADFTPAAAQLYGWESYGRAPFWEQRPRQQKRNGYYGYDWGYGDSMRRSPVVRSGGSRPAIGPKAPAKIAFTSDYPANSIVIDSDKRMLYYVLSPTEAYQYPISVGREGFSWTGTETISRMQAWPDWHPPKEMIRRDPRLPDKMTGGLKNPLGAKALYLGSTLYRIHGTNDPKSIGRAASSGCFRMMNEHVLHLASLAKVGTQVTVVKKLPPQTVAVRATPADEPVNVDEQEALARGENEPAPPSADDDEAAAHASDIDDQDQEEEWADQRYEDRRYEDRRYEDPRYERYRRRYERYERYGRY
ncbi:MAG TPA: L,D-transpeptidase [Hyphomicrobium sp.]|nr:L,D-transpeptidase [Hyphomicrobium sp.]